MRYFATWIGVFYSLFFQTQRFLLPWIIGHPSAFEPRWKNFHTILLLEEFLMFGLTAWALVYLYRNKEKTVHEKTGMVINLYWVIVNVFTFGSTLFLPKAN